MKCFFIHLICTNHGLNAMNNAICIVIENVINEARFSVQTAVCYQIKLKKYTVLGNTFGYQKCFFLII